MKTIVKNGLVITFIHEGYHSIKMKYADILIENGLFADVREEICDPDAKIIDAKGKWVLPGFVDVGSSCAAAVLCNGLIPDYSRARWQGSMIHGRVLPLLQIAADVLTDDEKRAIVRFALLQALDSGITTVSELTHPAFARFVREEAAALGLRCFVSEEATAAGYPCTEHSGLYRNPGLTGGSFPEEGGLYSVETTSDVLYAAARRADRLMVRAAYCEYEKQFSRMTFGVSPLGKLTQEGVLHDRTIVIGGYDTDFFDRERLRTAGATVTMSAVTAMQDGVSFPIVTNLKQDINTCLSTGYYGMSMLDEMKLAAFGGKLDSHASQFQASDAFYAATIAGAQGLHENLGRIEPGFHADLLLVDPARLAPHNYPLIQFVYRAETRDIVSRMVAGRVLPHSEKDTALASAAAQSAAEKVWSAAQSVVL